MMAPSDINNVASSSFTCAGSRANQQQSPSSTVTTHAAHAPSDSTSSSRRQSQQLSAGSEQFPTMPQRHSRPMTPAEMHAELEREQEGIVNRLTRELESLRAHSSSIASNTSGHSSSSNPTASLVGSSNINYSLPSVAQPPTPALAAPADPLGATNSTSALLTTAPSLSQPITSPRYPTPTRMHRSSSSSMSSRTQSMTSSSPAFSVPASMTNSTAAPLGSSQASVDRARDAAGVHMPSPHVASNFHLPRSRHGSMRSTQPSPAPPMSTSISDSGLRRPSMQVSSGRVEEATAARKSLDDAKAEHEELVKKVRELERQLRSLRGNEESRGRPTARGFVAP